MSGFIFLREHVLNIQLFNSELNYSPKLNYYFVILLFCLKKINHRK